MKVRSIRELRQDLANIEDVLRREGEIQVSKRGRIVARIVPPARPSRPRSHADLRARMKPMRQTSQELIREDRDR